MAAYCRKAPRNRENQNDGHNEQASVFLPGLPLYFKPPLPLMFREAIDKALDKAYVL